MYNTSPSVVSGKILIPTHEIRLEELDLCQVDTPHKHCDYHTYLLLPPSPCYRCPKLLHFYASVQPNDMCKVNATALKSSGEVLGTEGSGHDE
eukprot:8649752-Ditylum_brightwellii.AAC.1